MIDYENNYIAKAYLIHGEYYAGVCRNAVVARWDAHRKCFVYNRTKFGDIFTETIEHPADTTNPRADVFYPLAFLGETLPTEIELD